MGLHFIYIPVERLSLAKLSDYHHILKTSDSSVFETANWDEVSYFPQFYTYADNSMGTDPFTNYSENWRGWGAFGPLPNLIAAAWINLSGNYYLGMALWACISFSAMFYFAWFIFRKLFDLPQTTATVCTFIVIFFPYVAAGNSSFFFNSLPYALYSGVPQYKQSRVTCGLITYPFYFMVLSVYWSYLKRPTRSGGMLLGLTSGLMAYIYYHHFIFIAALLAVRATMQIVLDRDYKYLKIVVTCILVATPAFINNGMFLHYARQEYTYNAVSLKDYGRIPFSNYPMLSSLIIPFVMFALHRFFTKNKGAKDLLGPELLSISLAYFAILNARVLLGYDLDSSHYWRYSLGIPLTFWFLLTAADMFTDNAQSPKRAWLPASFLFLFCTALLLRATILYAHSLPKVLATLPDKIETTQRQLMAELAIMSKLSTHGDGFITSDTLTNNHFLLNGSGRPFVPFFLSPCTLDETARRYLIACYLTGNDDLRHEFISTLKSYHNNDGQIQNPPLHPVNTKNPMLYLYHDLFTKNYAGIPSKSRIIAEQAESYNQAIENTALDNPALNNVRIIFVLNSTLSKARERIPRHFSVLSELESARGTFFVVDRPSALDLKF